MTAIQKNKVLKGMVIAIPLVILTLFGFVDTTPAHPTAIGGSVQIKENYDFIRYDKNQLQFFGKKEKWNALFDQFDQLIFEGKGNIDIVHVGGSHVQAGFLTDRLRYDFSLLTNGVNGERGFLFPYKLAGTNTSKNIQCQWTGKWRNCRNALISDSCLWGMSGINAVTTDSSAHLIIAATSLDSVAYTFNKVRVYFEASHNYDLCPDSGFVPVATEFNMEVGYVEWSFGQSITQFGFELFRMDSIPGSFGLQGIYLGNDNPGVAYHAIGVNGAGTYSYLRCANFEKQVQTLSPDMVVFGIGVNDANVQFGSFDQAAYEARYDSIIQHFLNVNPKTCFLFITNNDTYYLRKHPNKNALLVAQSMKRLALKYDGAVFDFFEIMGGLGSIKKWQKAGMAADDKVHFSKRGYELKADLLYTAFRKSLGDYLEKKYQ